MEFDTKEWRLEARGLLALAGPVVGAQLGMMLMGTVDTMMLGRVSATALAAGGLGNSVSFGLLMLPMGILMGLGPLVSQAFGAGEHSRIAGHLQRGLVVAVLASVPVSLMMWRTDPVLLLLGQREPHLSEAATYLRFLVPGNAAFFLFVAFRQSLQAMHIVWPAFLAIILGNVVNVVANYALIFGNLGFPRLEVGGSAIATSLSRWVMVLSLLGFSFPALRPYLHRVSALFQWRSFRGLFALGVPIGLQISLEGWVFSTVAVVMGSIGSRELAGHQIALNLAGLSFMIPLGLSAAASTRVGNAIGRSDQAAAGRAAVVGLCLGSAVMACFGSLFAAFPTFLSRLFTADPEVVGMAALLLPIAAAFQLADGAQVVGAGILRGTADTRVPAMIALVGYWIIGLPTGLWLAFRVGWGPEGLWWGLTLGLAIVALLFIVRIRVRFGGEIRRVERE